MTSMEYFGRLSLRLQINGSNPPCNTRHSQCIPYAGHLCETANGHIINDDKYHVSNPYQMGFNKVARFITSIMRVRTARMNIDLEFRSKVMMEPLTAERFRELWSRTYNTEGKPDWSHIFPYYHENIVFEDSIQRIEGLAEFRAMCARLTRRCEQLNMEIISLAMNPNEIFFQWKMVMMFNKYPPTPLYGCSKLTLGPDNRIIHQRDYFDLWGDIFNGIPYFRKTYRKFLRKHFG